MASRAQKLAWQEPAEGLAANPVVKQFKLVIDGVSARAISWSSTGLTVIAESALPAAGAIQVELPYLGRRAASIVFRSDTIGTLQFDSPLTATELDCLAAYPERSNATAASRSNR